MKNIVRRLSLLLVTGLLVAVLLFVPDALYAWSNPYYQASLTTREAAAFWLVAMLFLATPWRWAAWSILGLIAALQLCQLLYFAYFGTQPNPLAIHLLVEETAEIRLTLGMFLKYLWWPLALVVGSNLAAGWLWRATRGRVSSTAIAPAILLAILIILPVRASHATQAQAFFPYPTETSLHNSLFALSFILGRAISGQSIGIVQRYAPYTVKEGPAPRPQILVLVMGESLTWKHMQLFGYERETTPRLMQWRNDSAFAFMPALAGGTTTKVSLPSFFNVVREPGYTRQLTGGSNLIRLAKARGMAVYFVSAQNVNLATCSGAERADLFLTKESMEKAYAQKWDEVLLDALAQIPLDRPTLIVLHQRNSHSPYEKFSRPAYWRWPIEGLPRHDYTVNSYDNSIRHTDAILDHILHEVKARSTLPAYVLFTSDHGEMMGEKGEYGHTLLDIEVARVPFLFWASDRASPWLAEARSMHEPSHYDIGRLVARMLGYTIVNPNDDGRTRFVNGPDIAGTMGWLRIAKPVDRLVEENDVRVEIPYRLPQPDGTLRNPG